MFLSFFRQNCSNPIHVNLRPFPIFIYSVDFHQTSRAPIIHNFDASTFFLRIQSISHKIFQIFKACVAHDVSFSKIKISNWVEKTHQKILNWKSYDAKIRFELDLGCPCERFLAIKFLFEGVWAWFFAGRYMTRLYINSRTPYLRIKQSEIYFSKNQQT